MRDTLSAMTGSPEVALLVQCARARLDSPATHALRELVGAVTSWSRVLELGYRHRLIPLLHTHLTAVANDVLPDDIRTILRADFVANGAKNLALATELLEILEMLDRHEIRALAFKGPTFTQCIYGSLAARQMKDVDLLVRANDAARVTQLLSERGFGVVTRVLPAARYFGLEYQTVLTRMPDEMIIELHWSIVPRAVAPRITVDDLWPNRLETAMLGSAVPSPSHEDMLAILCIHGSKHQWARLDWICCVAELLRTKPLDWIEVLARAEQWHATRMLSTGLVLAADLLEAPVPSAVLSVARADPDVHRLVTSVMDRLFVEDEVIDRRSLHAFQRDSQDSARDRARYVWYRPLISGARFGTRVVSWVAEQASR